MTRNREVKWPKEETLRRIDSVLSKARGSATIPPDAGPTLCFKFDLACQIIDYMKSKNLNQRELAKILDIHEARVSEIAHYRLGRILADTLMSYVERLNKNARFRVA